MPGSERVVTREEFDALPLAGRAALIDVMKRYSRGDTLRDEVKALGNGLLELRVNVGNDHFRLLFFQDSPVHDVVVLAVAKKQRRLPSADLGRAQKRMRVWQDQGRRT